MDDIDNTFLDDDDLQEEWAEDAPSKTPQSKTTKPSLPTVYKQVNQNSVLAKEEHLKSHELVFAASDMTSVESNLFALMLTDMVVHDWFDGDKEVEPAYRFNADTVAKFCGYKSTRNLRTSLRKPCDNLAGRRVGLRSDTDPSGFRYIPIMSAVEYGNGVLTMKPNPELRKHYVIKVLESDGDQKRKGHAAINNQVYVDIKKPTGKKLFEMLSRHKSYSQYPVTIDHVKRYLGVIGERGYLKPAYKTQHKFLKGVVESSIASIANSKKAQKVMVFLRDPKSGNLGYRIDDEAGVPKIQFLYRFLDEEQALTQIDEEQQRAMKGLKFYAELKRERNREGGALTPSEMREVAKLLATTGDKERSDRMFKAADDKEEEDRRRYEEEAAKKKRKAEDELIRLAESFDDLFE